MNAPQQQEILVIGVGSTLRGDDAAGRRVAELVEQLHVPHVRTMSVTQLVPELAARIAVARAAIFVDACADQEMNTVTIRQLANGLSAGMSSHAGGPQELLALAETCYGFAPPAWLVAVPGADFALTDQLSAAAQKHIAAAAWAIESLLHEMQQSEVVRA
jgi:hydrogenase maturation protease